MCVVYTIYYLLQYKEEVCVTYWHLYKHTLYRSAQKQRLQRKNSKKKLRDFKVNQKSRTKVAHRTVGKTHQADYFLEQVSSDLGDFEESEHSG